jgi:transposase
VARASRSSVLVADAHATDARHRRLQRIDAVGEMDLEGFYAGYRVDGRCRPPYDSAMVVALLLYAYARGIPSSWAIERACVEDVAFRVIAALQRPDHATIARFVANRQQAVAGLFGEVLTLCARSGLANVGVIAVDGTKVAANASRNENLDYEQLARALVERAIATDQAEDELYGQARGDELPPEFSTTAGRKGWLRVLLARLAADNLAPLAPASMPGISGHPPLALLRGRKEQTTETARARSSAWLRRDRHGSGRDATHCPRRDARNRPPRGAIRTVVRQRSSPSHVPVLRGALPKTTTFPGLSCDRGDRI